jgi:lipoprotein NlpI
MCRMTLTSRTVLLQLHPAGIIATVFLCRIVPLLAIRTFQGNNRADTFFLRHNYFTMVVSRKFETTMYAS